MELVSENIYISLWILCRIHYKRVLLLVRSNSNKVILPTISDFFVCFPYIERLDGAELACWRAVSFVYSMWTLHKRHAYCLSRRILELIQLLNTLSTKLSSLISTYQLNFPTTNLSGWIDRFSNLFWFNAGFILLNKKRSELIYRLYISPFVFLFKQLLRIKEEHRRDHERKMVELREASRRMKEDCEHQIEIERFVAERI